MRWSHPNGASIRPARRGLSLIHSCETIAEAAMLRDLVIQTGFHVEYVPPVTTGILGTGGKVGFEVKASQADEVRTFIEAISQAPPSLTGPAPAS